MPCGRIFDTPWAQKNLMPLARCDELLHFSQDDPRELHGDATMTTLTVTEAAIIDLQKGKAAMARRRPELRPHGGRSIASVSVIDILAFLADRAKAPAARCAAR
jgi:hypothetical protein